ncbi:MAG: hypothetical protein JSS13_03510, partial [Proteobacteria bacterium]|nr:hypothetical protein [Pseudomonadota bacterium]
MKPARLRARILPALLAMIVSASVVAAGIPPVVADDGAVAAVVDLVTGGDFKAAQARIDFALKSAALPADERAAFEFQHERMQRMR